MGKYFKELYSWTYLITFIKTNYLLNVNLNFYLVILTFHSYYLLLMILTLHLTVILHRMLGVKAFDNVWHKGLLFKLKTYSVKGELLSLPLLKLIVLNGQISSLELIKPEVPQGLSLVLLLFLIYINNLPDNIQFTCKIFTDDASLFFTCF